jgi:hypothetical protein
MTIFYYPNPALAPNSKLPQYVAGPAPTSTGVITGDFYVSQAGAVTHLEPGTGLNAGKNIWNKYILSSPVVPTKVPPIVVTTIVPTTDAVPGQPVNFTPVTAYGGAGVATSYTTTGTVTGLNVSVSPTLPAGLSVTSTFTVSKITGADSIARLYNSVNVSIVGTPTVSVNTASYTVTVTDSTGLTNSSSFNFSAKYGDTTLTTTLAQASYSLTQNRTTGLPFTPVRGIGGLGALTYTVTPSLPTGLTLNSSTGQITGTPTGVAVVTAYTVTVSDTLSQTSSKSFNLSVSAVPVVTVLAVPTRTFTKGVAITAFTPVTATGGTGALSWAVSPALPAGLTLNTANGSISGTATTSAAASNYVVTVSDSNTPVQTSSQTFNLTVNALAPLTSTVPTASYALTKNTAVTAFVPVAGAGGYGTLTYGISPSLPTGLSFATASGSVTGTPTAISSTASYSVTVADQASQLSSGTFSLSVAAIAIATAYTSAQTAWTFIKNVAATAFTPVRGSGGDGTLAYSILPALPTGLTLSTTTGAISGTPTVDSVAATYTITVTDQAAQNSSKTVSFTVNNPTALTVATVQAVTTVTQGAAIVPFQPVSGTGGYLSLTYTVSPALPTGLNIGASTGQISGTPSAFTTATNSYSVTVKDQAQQVGTSTFNLRVATLPIIATQRIPSQTLINGVAVSPFVPVTAAGGTTVYSFSVLPALPSGLSLNTGTGAISGTPTGTQGATSYTISVADTLSQTTSSSVSLTINNPPALTTAVTAATVDLVKGVTNANVSPISASGGYGSITFSINPSLPASLTFSAAGKITGVAGSTVNQLYSVVASDSVGQTSTQTFTLNVINPPVVITTSTSTVSLQQYKATSSTPIGFTGGVTPVTFSIAPSLPTGLAFNASNGNISGTPTALSGASSYSITVTDSVGGQGTGTISLAVVAPPAVSATTLVASVVTTVTQAMNVVQPVLGSNGVGTLTYSISPGLPNGIVISAGTGQLSGSPVDLKSTTTYTVTVTDSVAQTSATTFTLESLPVKLSAVVRYSGSKALTIYSAVSPEPFIPVEAAGGYGTISWAISPSLPTGLSFNLSSGEISGTPTVGSAAQPYSITVSDTASQVATGTFILSVNDVIYPDLVAAVKVSKTVFTVNTVDAVIPVEASGGLAPYSYSIFPATLPDGLGFDTTNGEISGVATTSSSTATYTVTVTDSVPQNKSVDFDLSVVPQIITAPTIQSNLTLTNGTKSISTTTGALIVGGGVGIRGDVNIGGVLHVFNGTQSTGTGTGALIVDGGVSVGKRLSAESIKIADTVLDSGLILLNTTATTIVDVYSVNDYRAAKYLIQIDSGSGPTADFQVIEILLLVDNIQTVYATEYGVLTTNGELGEFAADVQNDNNVRLYFTPYQATDKAISVLRTGMVV